ncbi:MAG: 2-C-methyl-D-erythritol 4-phosphate cytidylyltransferase [Rhodoferax sp.]|jgi:2-C-methyl-D-erythritol 4-phosphate cytidylyltransferase|uniref:2-C-methyl-D-erythritol 4-phosphate cytidylyltransferase n=1 Tax=Rhodoferax sp. TaxID=50421 RepID=UPI001B6C1173|nr:2-C-methyl-D-erythritol 4-phosphate cytidylyltransferase [Rhodoferax sp.]MBP9148525.1 2-C-methyl-D-erythritol 4-phosphate cytidylyltransferase [Rhodoferax sp.]
MTELTHIALAPAAMPRCWALIPCAGTGSRAGVAGPKQYQIIAGKPMVMHTLAAFAEVARIDQTLVVVSPDDRFFQTPQALNASFVIASCGGSTRAGSVFNGLNALLDEGAVAHDWVLVHDAARCLITPAQINQLLDACLNDEVGGLLALPLPDTLKAARADRVTATLPRADKWLAQTPQMFRIGSLLDALELAGDTVTDESSAIEAMGLAPRLVPGSAQNFKVTYPPDFELAQAILASRQA